jgi:hypothetical protein
MYRYLHHQWMVGLLNPPVEILPLEEHLPQLYWHLSPMHPTEDYDSINTNTQIYIYIYIEREIDNGDF